MVDKNEENINTLSSYPVCDVENIPLQRWVHVGVTMWNKTSDVYINGKLVRTVKLSHSLPDNFLKGGSIDHSIHGTSGSDFNGKTSKFEYYPEAVNPQQAWNIYREGYGAGLLSSLMNKYKLKFAFIKDDMEYSSFVI